MVIDAPFRDFDLYDAQIQFENEKLDELREEIEPQIKMIENFAKQIGVVVRIYKEDFDLDFTDDVMQDICDAIHSKL